MCTTPPRLLYVCFEVVLQDLTLGTVPSHSCTGYGGPASCGYVSLLIRCNQRPSHITQIFPAEYVPKPDADGMKAAWGSQAEIVVYCEGKAAIWRLVLLHLGALLPSMCACKQLDACPCLQGEMADSRTRRRSTARCTATYSWMSAVTCSSDSTPCSPTYRPPSRRSTLQVLIVRFPPNVLMGQPMYSKHQQPLPARRGFL